MGFFNRIIVKLLPLFPASFIWVFSRRYIAGRTLEDGVEKTRELNRMGIRTTMDVLGEEIATLEEAEAEKRECLRVLEVQHRERLDATLSLKLTSLGLRLDRETCFANVREIVARAAETGNFVRIDMEDSSCTDDTLAIYRRLRKEYANVGTVIQACLKRTREDVRRLIDEGIADLRICKGIYIESADIAFKDREEVRESFMDVARMMLASGSYAAIATHDRQLVDRTFALLGEIVPGRDRYEFQMLLGVTEKMRSDIVSRGEYMRVYVPFGEQWYAYSMRRLQENPAVAGHIIRNLFFRK
ncbi:proline dehydrogenase family protein [bacterium]|nr:proline dehydrogenase family protein [bacterium]